MILDDALTHSVMVCDPHEGNLLWITISAFCPQCGERRGVPRLRPRRINGVETWVHHWENPCGHQDGPENLPTEIALQCSFADCTMTQSSSWGPYCGPGCCVKGMWDALATVATAAQALTAPLEECRRMAVIVSDCPFEDEAEDLIHVLREASRGLAKTQEKLTGLSADVIAGCTVFTDHLGDLIANATDEQREKHPGWMNPPESWDAACDPRWRHKDRLERRD